MGSTDRVKLPVKIGEGLGDLCDELPADVFIKEWSCNGPKSYGLARYDREYKVVVKGITLSSCHSDTLTFECLKNMVLGKGPKSITLVDPWRIVRKAQDNTMTTQPKEKTYKVV